MPVSLADGVGRSRDLDHLDAVFPGEVTGSPSWWQAVVSAGTPLRVATPAGVPEVLLFLCRDSDSRGAYVDLVGLTDRDDLTAGTMDRVPGTDVWWAAFGVAPGFVGSYGLVPLEGALVSPAARDTDQARRWWLSVLARSRSDPLNPGPTFRGMRDEPRSVASASGAETAGGLTPPRNVAGGELVETLWVRTGGGREHPVWIYLPPGRHTCPLPLVVLLDGQIWANNVPAAPVLDALRDQGRMPPVVAVLVSSCDRAARSIDLTCSDAFVDALADDLLPGLVADLLAARGLTATQDPSLSAVVGQSYGGLTALYAAARRPDRFGLVLSQSGSFWWPDPADASVRRIAGWLRSAPPRATRTVLQVGAYERVLTEANREVAELIESRGEWLRLTEVPGGHDWAWWRSRLAEGLEALFEL